MKRFFALLLSSFAVVLYLNLDKFTTLKIVEPDIEKELKEKATKEFLEERIENALLKDKIPEAKEYIELSKSLNRDINQTLIERVEERENSFDYRFKNAKKFASGFLYGEVNGSYSLAGSITSDMTIVGDVRDLYKEGKRYLAGEEYDKFILTISFIGVGLSISTVATLGASATLKVGASVLKVAKRAKFLTKRFSRVIISKLSKSVNLRVLKRVDFSSINSIRRNSKAFVSSINIAPVQGLLKDVNKIKDNSSLMGSLKVLKYVDSEKELQKAVKISNKFKKQTPTVLKVLGKSALRGAKGVLKYSKYYLYALASVIISFFISLYLLLF